MVLPAAGEVVVSDYERFYAETWPALASYAMSLTRDEAVAADLAQEALTRVYVRWRLLRDPRAFAYRVVTNLVRDRWRHQGTARAAMRDLVDHRVVAEPDTGLLDAVRRLPERLRVVVALHYYADLPVADVARVVGKPVGTVKSRLHDARAALARALEDQR
jgi:RNA polymerase sigma-70 factor, ECF subfamily